jgi:hypothetical protein
MTLLSVVGETLAPGVNARDTAESETSARSATSCAVTLLLLINPLSVGNFDNPIRLTVQSRHLMNMPYKDLSLGAGSVNRQQRQGLNKYSVLVFDAQTAHFRLNHSQDG